jgi:hypothetical protein
VRPFFFQVENPPAQLLGFVEIPTKTIEPNVLRLNQLNTYWSPMQLFKLTYSFIVWTLGSLVTYFLRYSPISIYEVTTAASLLTGTSPTTEGIAPVNPRINPRKWGCEPGCADSITRNLTSWATLSSLIWCQKVAIFTQLIPQSTISWKQFNWDWNQQSNNSNFVKGIR